MAEIPKPKRGDEVLFNKDISTLSGLLGWVVIVWGMVEEEVRATLSLVGLISEPDTSIGRVILSETPFRSQISMLRKIAYARWPDSEWFAELQQTLGEVETKLHDTRNRLIHDPWLEHFDGTLVTEERGKGEMSLPKKGELKLIEKKPKPASLAEIKAFGDKANAVREVLLRLRMEYISWCLQNDKFPQHVLHADDDG